MQNLDEKPLTFALISTALYEAKRFSPSTLKLAGGTVRGNHREICLALPYASSFCDASWSSYLLRVDLGDVLLHVLVLGFQQTQPLLQEFFSVGKGFRELLLAARLTENVFENKTRVFRRSSCIIVTMYFLCPLTASIYIADSYAFV